MIISKINQGQNTAEYWYWSRNIPKPMDTGYLQQVTA